MGVACPAIGRLSLMWVWPGEAWPNWLLEDCFCCGRGQERAWSFWVREGISLVVGVAKVSCVVDGAGLWEGRGLEDRL